MSQDNDLLRRLGANPPGNDESSTTPIPIRIQESREAGEAALHRAAEEERQGRDIVAEYENRYHGNRKHRRVTESGAAEKARSALRNIEWRPGNAPISGLTDDERLWAALAHLSFWLTVITAFFTDGWSVLGMAFVPLVIYFSFRDKSDFVAFHALQAFAAQVIGTLGWLVLLLIGSIVFSIAITIAGLASVVLIGIPFVIIFSLLFIVFVLAMLVVPIAVFIMALIGGINTYNGNDFRYPIIAQWIDRQISSTSISL
ncbi:MAG: DUF4870 domain-containing protein [Anaerolineae bacterium]|nr:DUF4870 domain-containing protein [Anaerolineae bacterium]